MSTRVYKYGARAPHKGLDAAHAEERAMHRLRNMLVEVERDRREAARELVREHHPDIAETETRLDEIETEISELRSELKRRNAEARARRPDTDPATPRIRELRAERRAIIGRHDKDADPCECWRCRRRRAFGAPAVRDGLDTLDQEARAREKAMYAERDMSWCNFNAIKQSLGSIRSGPDPRFMPWTGQRGRLVVQIQGGASWGELLAGRSQVKIRKLPLPPNAKPGGRRSKRPYYEIRMRIGRDARGDNQSRWITSRFVLHRPIPEGSRIQQVWLVRRRVGVTNEWSVQFVLRHEEKFARADTARAEGPCGVDLRWRQDEDGNLIVAHVEGSDGHAETLRIPREQIDRIRYPDHLRSIRDRDFDAAKTALVHWLSEHEGPEWLREETKTIAQWRSAGRLAALIIRWRERRFEGDDQIYERIESWRAQDKHLADWAGAQRRGFEAWRLDHYRRFAARLRWRYETVIVEDADWRELLRRPSAEDADEPEALNRRWYARTASPGMIRHVIGESVEDTREAPSADTSRTCSVCGEGPSPSWDPMTEVRYRCINGHSMLTWRNAARNLLSAASGEVVAA